MDYKRKKPSERILPGSSRSRKRILAGVRVVLILCGIILMGCSDEVTDPAGSDDTSPALQIDIVGYLPDYRIETVDPVIARKLTHLIYFSISPLADGNLDLTNFGLAEHNYLINFKTENPALNLIIAAGGWGRSDFFPEATLDPANRKRFVGSLVTFCKSYGFSGIDLDWEFPANNLEQDAYAQLISQLGDSCSAHRLSLSVALNIYQQISPSAYAHIDRVHIMSYDHSGRHATFEQSVTDAGIFLGRGIPSEKLYLGIPFYGRKIVDFSQALSYREIVARYDPPPEVDEVDGYYFNNIGTVVKKSEYAFRQNLGGVMIWELGQDADGEASLLTAIYNTAAADSLKK